MRQKLAAKHHGIYEIPPFFVLPIFPSLNRAGWTALGWKPAAHKVCVFSCWDKLRFRGELESYSTDRVQ